jgi:hypothetical protein
MPLPSTMIPIFSTTLNAATQTITFYNIPQTYTDLVLVSAFGATSGMDILVRFNADTGSNYGTVRMWANSSSGSASSRTTDTGIQPRTNVNQTSGALSCILHQNIMNYTNTSMYKSVVGRYNFPSQTEQHAGTWMSTAAINKVECFAVGNTFTAGSTFTLYGIKAA